MSFFNEDEAMEWFWSITVNRNRWAEANQQLLWLADRLTGPDQGALAVVARRLLLFASLALAIALALGLFYLLVDRPKGIGVFVSLAAGLATGVGAVPVLFMRTVNPHTLNRLLGAAAGVMLAATAFSLLEPGLEAAERLWGELGVFPVAAGLLFGAGFLILSDQFFPYHHLVGRDTLDESTRRIWLFILAVALHNLPEGWAVGVSYGAAQYADGLAVGVAIALQNVPEGLAVAMPMVALGYPKGWAVFIATLTGLIEPLGGLLGLVLAEAIPSLMPLGMAMAAGAMLFVIHDDIVPSIQSRGKERFATLAMLIGFVVMMILDRWLGS